MTEFVKSSGWDWLVTYQCDDEEPDVMVVFGQVKIEEVIEEARFSLKFNNYVILKVERL